MNKIILSIINLFLFTTIAASEETGDILSQAKISTNSILGSSGLVGSFSLGGIIAGFLFGSIGFVAFMYGKKNSLFKPMLIGMALMAYPYFIRSTIWTWVVGGALTFGLYIFRE